MMGPFAAASIVPSFSLLSEELGVTLHQVAYLVGLQVAILGSAPLLWAPLSKRFGRRPIFSLSLICSLVGNVGCAKCPGYSSLAACSALTAFFISPPSALGSAVVTECFPKKERGRYMGIWALMVTIGIPMAPLIFGFVAQRVGYRWIYWTLAIVSILFPHFLA
jgi:MFS family permease